MPYVTDVEREFLDPHVDKLADTIRDANIDGPTGFAGPLNYVVTRLLLRTLPAKRYWALALGIGTLICVIFEFYRRFVAPYEDKAVKKNGDIPEYANQ